MTKINKTESEYNPYEKYWGTQTQKSLDNFKIGTEKMPDELIRAYAYIKKAAALANFKLGRLSEEKSKLIAEVCDEIIEGRLKKSFPLSVWQTGSGTQTNMNLNEVIAIKINTERGENILHPNDDVNQSQSSNDTFPTAMHTAAVIEIENKLLDSLNKLIDTLKMLEQENKDIIKSGRTHLQDATPITFSQEISGWRSSPDRDRAMITDSLRYLKEIALGGTAVGTGLNSPTNFDKIAADELSRLTGKAFIPAANKFHALTSKDELVFTHSALKALACDLLKIANDIRWLASGPRCGLGEINIPENEAGSSIMPGKVNPTQCEAVCMVAVQVIANDSAVGIAASQGNFELNVYMPVLIYNFLQSVRLLSDAMESFNKNCCMGIKANKAKMQANLHNSLMLVTCLSPHIGYDNAAATAKAAFNEGISLKEACLKLGFLSPEKFDEVFKPEEMV